MSQDSHDYLVVNFGGPRSLEEIEPFLCALLTDKDVVRTKIPTPIHNFLFRRIAKKRAKKLLPEYAHMGGSSPIYRDTEAVAALLEKKIERPVITYHRYLPMTHKATFAALEASQAKTITVFPMFPQFSYATTGSAARHIINHISKQTEKKLQWIKSYGHHPDFVALFVARIRAFITLKGIAEENLILLFSSHGIPKDFVENGDPYERECEASFAAIAAYFPLAATELAYQSKFGRAVWLTPSTEDFCKKINSQHKNREHLLFVPLSFTSDHIETLVEIEQQYMPLIRERGLQAHRLDAFNQGEDWVDVMKNIILQFMPVTTRMLVRYERG